MRLDPWLEEWQVRKAVVGLLFEEKPRFKGCPLICISANLPSFESKAHAKEWHESPKTGNPLYEVNPIKKIWQCQVCNKWHFITKHRPPSGHTSGSSRTR